MPRDFSHNQNAVFKRRPLFGRGDESQPEEQRHNTKQKAHDDEDHKQTRKSSKNLHEETGKHAQQHGDEPKKKGFWSKLKDAFTPERDGHSDHDDDHAHASSKIAKTIETKQGFFTRIFGNKNNGNEIIPDKGDAHDSINQRYAQMGAPADWGKPSSELKHALKNEPNKVHYQEQVGNGFVSFGTLAMTDLKGNKQYFAMITGGAGRGSIVGTANGTGEVDPRYGRVVSEYTLSNYQKDRGDKPTFQVYDNGRLVKFSVDISDPRGTGRGLFRFHADGGKPGTIGCEGSHPRQSAEFEDVISEFDRHGKLDGKKFVLLPSEDKNNRYATHHRAPDDRVYQIAQEYKAGKYDSHRDDHHGRKPHEVAAAQNHERGNGRGDS